MTYLKLATVLFAAALMLAAAFRHREWRGGLLLVMCIFLAGAAQECEGPMRMLLPNAREPEVPLAVAFLLLGVVFAWWYRGLTLPALSAIWKNRRFPLLVWGILFISLIPNVVKAKFAWSAFSSLEIGTHDVREAAEAAAETLGCVLLLNWAILFLKDKWRVFVRRVGRLNRLVVENELVEIGRGTRRVAYKVGETGCCAKFYYPEEQCVESRKMQKSIQRDVRWRRFNKWRNTSCEEVYIYNSLRHRMPSSIRRRMPEVCERVFHPKWGWGVIETYYTNPDGTAIIPYEFEIRRQGPETREVIYAQARALLDELIAASAPFYEPGNFHVLMGEDGTVDLKIVDFEPSSKTLIPVEAVWPWFRRRKLARKADRYLRHIREKYGVTGRLCRSAKEAK